MYKALSKLKKINKPIQMEPPLKKKKSCEDMKRHGRNLNA
jgi:hypothetical protein